MLKKASILTLAILFFFNPLYFAKKADAAAAPAVLALTLVATSFAGFFGLQGPNLYEYMGKPYPAKVKNGPYFDGSIDGYYFIDTDDRKWIGDEKSKSWRLE